MVNTFLPYADFKKCAKVLDNKRLGKQRVEAKQIITTIENKTKAWSNHPAVLMWHGHVNELKYYCNCMIEEWIRRGYVNNMQLYTITKLKMPWFIGVDSIHYSYQANLLRKDYSYYSKIFNLPKFYEGAGYIWPSKLTEYEIQRLKKDKSALFRAD